MNSSVFIVNHSGLHSYDAAKPFGELVYLTRGYIDFLNDKEDIEKSIESLINTAKPTDYLLLSGNNLLCIMAFNLWMNAHGICLVLHTRDSGRSFEKYELHQSQHAKN